MSVHSGLCQCTLAYVSAVHSGLCQCTQAYVSALRPMSVCSGLCQCAQAHVSVPRPVSVRSGLCQCTQAYVSALRPLSVHCLGPTTQGTVCSKNRQYMIAYSIYLVFSSLCDKSVLHMQSQFWNCPEVTLSGCWDLKFGCESFLSFMSHWRSCSQHWVLVQYCKKYFFFNGILWILVLLLILFCLGQWYILVWTAWLWWIWKWPGPLNRKVTLMLTSHQPFVGPGFSSPFCPWFPNHQPFVRPGFSSPFCPRFTNQGPSLFEDCFSLTLPFIVPCQWAPHQDVSHHSIQKEGVHQ